VPCNWNKLCAVRSFEFELFQTVDCSIIYVAEMRSKVHKIPSNDKITHSSQGDVDAMDGGTFHGQTDWVKMQT